STVSRLERLRRSNDNGRVYHHGGKRRSHTTRVEQTIAFRAADNPPKIGRMCSGRTLSRSIYPQDFRVFANRGQRLRIDFTLRIISRLPRLATIPGHVTRLIAVIAHERRSSML